MSSRWQFNHVTWGHLPRGASPAALFASEPNLSPNTGLMLQLQLKSYNDSGAATHLLSDLAASSSNLITSFPANSADQTPTLALALASKSATHARLFWKPVREVHPSHCSPSCTENTSKSERVVVSLLTA